MATFRDPREIYSKLYDSFKVPEQTFQQGGGSAAAQAGAAAGSGSSAAAGGHGAAGPTHTGSTWGDILAAIQPFISADDYNLISSNQAKLNPMLNAGAAQWGGLGGILATAGKNPRKVAYTALSYLTGKPYYDRGAGATSNPFRVPGFDYGTVDDNWGVGTYGQTPGYWT